MAAVCGWPVGRVLGVRDRRHIRQNNSCTLFIDARTLGRPLCCRVLPSCQASLSQLLAAIDVSLPDSIIPEIVGGDIVWGRPDVRRFRHCSIVILWARDARDSLSSSPAVLPSDSSHEAEDPGGDDLSDGVDGCRDDGFQAGLSTARDENRSRSPARGGPAQGGSSGPAVLDDAGSKARGCCVKRVPVPTPCRAAALPPLAGNSQDGDAEPLPTLLETAARYELPYDFIRVWRMPLHVVAATPAAARPRRPDFELGYGDLRCPFSVEDMRTLLCTPARLVSLSEALSTCSVKDKTWFLSRAALAHSRDQEALLCYTDGSFAPSSGDSPAAVGWACAFFHVGPQPVDSTAACVGVVSGTIPAWVGCDQQPSAYMAECLALAFGGWVSARNFPDRDIVFLSDCVAALGVAEARTGYDCSDFAGVTQGLHLLRRASSSGSLQYRYVPGHQHIFGNELCDVLAKQAAKGRSLGGVTISEADRWLQRGGPYLPWFAAACRALRVHPEWPAMTGAPVGPLSPPSEAPQRLLEPFLPALPDEAAVHTPATGGLGGPTDDAVPVEISHMHAKLASYNALSLAEPCQRHKDQLHSAGLAFRVARPALLARCLEAAQVDIAAIQETRCGPGTLITGPYYRVCAGSENGSFGTELWFKIGKPILRRGRSIICIQPHHIIVHHASPRRLLVSLEPGSSKLFILALHAPHRGAESHTISTWWETTLSLCREFVRDAECIIAGDMNASIGSVCTPQVGDFAAEEEDLSGALLRQLMQQCGAWAPASFDSCHQGQSWTYRQKRNGRMIRPDLIAIPDGWWWGQVWSQVDVGIHAGQVSPDHYATTVEVRVNLCQKATCKRRASAHGRRYDVAAISKPENQGLVAEVFRSLPLVPWQVSAHTHAWQLVDHLQDNFQRLFPLTGRRARKKHSFLSDATWEIHAEVVRLRRACARCRTHETRHLLAAVLSVWRSQPGDQDFEDCYYTAWLRQTRRAHARYCQQLDLRGAQLRAACVTDRAGYLADCAAQVAAGRDREAPFAGTQEKEALHAGCPAFSSQEGWHRMRHSTRGCCQMAGTLSLEIWKRA